MLADCAILLPGWSGEPKEEWGRRGGDEEVCAMKPVVDAVGSGSPPFAFEKNDVILPVFAFEAFEVVAFLAALRHPGEPQCCRKFLSPPSPTQCSDHRYHRCNIHHPLALEGAFVDKY